MLKHLLFALSVVNEVWSHPVSDPELPATNATSQTDAARTGLYQRHKTTAIRIQDKILGERDVAYYLTPQGQAIIDGDIRLGTEADLLARKVSNTSSNSTSLINRSFSTFLQFAWPNSVVFYKYDSDATQNRLKPTVDAAIARWRNAAPYLVFQPVRNDAVPIGGVLLIRESDCGCHCNVGYDASAGHIMNLDQGLNPLCKGGCGIDEATHEFGHALGLLHEHQRPDREEYVHYSCENLRPDCDPGFSLPVGSTCCNSNGNGHCCFAASDFAIYPPNQQYQASAYNTDSLMHYRTTAFSLPGTQTLTPIRANIFLRGTNPTDPDAQDAERICSLYRNQCPRALDCRRQNCPASCGVSSPLCLTSPRCGDRNPPRCCDADANEACRREKERCQRAGCNFL